MNITRIVLVTKRTQYEELLLRYSTHGNAAFLLHSRDESITKYVDAHSLYQQKLQAVERVLPKDVAHTLTSQVSLPQYHFRQNDLIIAIGVDGLFVNLAKYLSGQPVIGLNPNPRMIDGVVMRSSASSVSGLVQAVMDDTAAYDEITLAEAKTSEGTRLLAVNDFLVGRLDHVSARYKIAIGQLSEHQSSSGVLISTGLGSSGWMRSIRTAVEAGADGYSTLSAPPSWDERRLTFAVREPFPSRQTGTSIVYGDIYEHEPLTITSEMPEGGVVFSDGVPQDALQLPAGSSLQIGLAEEKVFLVRP